MHWNSSVIAAKCRSDATGSGFKQLVWSRLLSLYFVLTQKNNIFRPGTKTKATRKDWVTIWKDLHKRQISRDKRGQSGTIKKTEIMGFGGGGSRTPSLSSIGYPPFPTLERKPWLVAARWRFPHRKRSRAVIGRSARPLVVFVKTYSSPQQGAVRHVCSPVTCSSVPVLGCGRRGTGGECL